MTVQELIKELEKYNPKSEAMMDCGDVNLLPVDEVDKNAVGDLVVISI